MHTHHLAVYSRLSPLAMAEWIEIHRSPFPPACPASPLAMAEWIEISKNSAECPCPIVSASDGGVD